MPGSSGAEKWFFWLGFLAASILWFLAIRYRRLWPEVRRFFREKFTAFRSMLTAGTEEVLRQETVNRAQAYHAAAALFSLDQIAVEPHLLAPPAQFPSKKLSNQRIFFSQALSTLPEAPLFAALYSAPRLTLCQALKNGAKIAVVGDPGCGKSTALAFLTALIARRDARAGALAHLFPIFIHISDVHPLERAADEPVDALVKAVLYSAPRAGPQSSQFICTCLEANSAILLLDGLDELSPAELELAVDFLSALLSKYPDLRLMTAAAQQSGRHLLSAGIQPIALAGWSRQEAQDFLHKWTALWNAALREKKDSRPAFLLDDLLLSSWLNDSPVFHSPSEWTMKIWAACSGDLEGNSIRDAIQAYLKRHLAQIPIDGLTSVCGEMIARRRSTLPAAEFEKLLSTASTFNHGGTAIDHLLAAGILREHGGNRLSFASPWLTGYLASRMELNPAHLQPGDFSWSAFIARAGFSLAQQKQPWLADYLQDDRAPLHASLSQASAWLRYIPLNHEHKTMIMRSLQRVIQREETSFSVRLSLLANIATCNDPAVPLLFRQWLTLDSPRMRQLAVLGLGASQDKKSLSEIVLRLEDAAPEVRYAACYALSAPGSQNARDELLEALNSGDETIKQVAAEILAAQDSAGHEALKTAARSEDLLIRRASVYGLSLISEPWVDPLLEKIASEDIHWVVRNAAAQAREDMKGPIPTIPASGQKYSNSAWLIEFAARSGQSVSIQESPVPLLLQAIRSGKIEEQISALWMMRDHPDPQLIAEAVNFLQHANLDLRETAHYVLWQMQPID